LEKIILAILISLFSLSSCLPNPCDNEIISENYNASHNYRAVVFTRGCGATTLDSTQVSIIGKNSKLKNNPGNIFIKLGKGFVETKWVDDKTLLIKYKHAIKKYKQIEEWSGIKIKYELLN
jgi:hypothetical protein